MQILSFFVNLNSPDFFGSDVCRKPDQVGPCRASMQKWSYNQDTGRCELFMYGGCGESNNRFSHKQSCEAVCVRMRTSNPGAQRKAPEPRTSSCENFKLPFIGQVNLCNMAGWAKTTYSKENLFFERRHWTLMSTVHFTIHPIRISLTKQFTSALSCTLILSDKSHSKREQL